MERHGGQWRSRAQCSRPSRNSQERSNNPCRRFSHTKLKCESSKMRSSNARATRCENQMFVIVTGNFSKQQCRWIFCSCSKKYNQRNFLSAPAMRICTRKSDPKIFHDGPGPPGMPRSIISRAVYGTARRGNGQRSVLFRVEKRKPKRA